MPIVFPASYPPKDRALTGQDLLDFQRYAQLDLNQMQYCFGIASRNAWYRITRKQLDQPLRDMSIANLIRVYVAYPELMPIHDLNLPAIAEKLGMSTLDLAVLSGRAPLSGREWEKGKPALASTQSFVRALRGGVELDADFIEKMWEISNLERTLSGRELKNFRRSAEGVKKRVRRTDDVVAVDDGMIQGIDEE